MVSLINFKIVNEELAGGQQAQQAASTNARQQQQHVAQVPINIDIQQQQAPRAVEPFRSSSSEQELGPSEANFVVTWRDLRFVIEPKWHKRVLECAPASACQQAPAKLVLDNLDGSFRSGELTAILGPSGKFDWRCFERIVVALGNRNTPGPTINTWPTSLAD